MKISVRDGESNLHFSIWIPNTLLAGAPAKWIINKALEHTGTNNGITADQILQLTKALKQSVRTHGHYELVRVESRDGDVVIIRI